MYQKTFMVHSGMEMRELTASITIESHYQRAAKTLVLMFSSRISEQEVKNACQTLSNAFPNIETAGFSLFGNEQLNISTYIAVTFLFFDESDVEVITRDVTGFAPSQTVFSLAGKLRSRKDLKGIMLVPTGSNVKASEIIRIMGEEYPDIPIFGALASNTAKKDASMTEMVPPFVIGNGRIVREGVLVIAFSGKNLNIDMEYGLGWKAIGRPMVAEIDESGALPIGDTILKKLGGVPASKIYSRYLHIREDEYYLYNIMEFPFMIERNGFSTLRVPFYTSPDHELAFFGDIKQGEDVRIGYGNPKNLLNESFEESQKIEEFRPEALLLFDCMSRFILMNDGARTEIGYFQSVCNEMIYGHGAGEVYQYKNQGGLLSGSIVAVGMREGEADKMPRKKRKRETDEIKSSGVIPLEERLISFLEQTTSELNEMAIRAESANKLKSDFLSNMSHEIRTPINAILGMDEMILREGQDDQIREYAWNIKNAGTTLLGLINDILDFSKIEAGKMEIIPVDYDLQSVLNDLVNMIDGRASEKMLDFRVEVDPEIPYMLNGDEIRIKQIATNILTNAVKYTKEGYVLFKVGYEKKDEDTIILKMSVKDTGMGIREEDIDKLFTAFERIDEKVNRTIEGTGLGMNITKKLLRAMGGKMDVTSEYGKGSTFTFSLEQPVIHWNPVGDYQERLRESRKKMALYQESFIAPDASIMIVDDTPMNIQVIRGLLKKSRIKIDGASGGMEAIRMAVENKYDIIFLDHRMPGMDGVETLNEMNRLENFLNESTPKICLTANAISGAREEYLRQGFSDYLTKPVRPEQLEAMLRKYLPDEKILPPDETEASGDISAEETAGAKENENIPGWLFSIQEIDPRKGIEFCGSAEDFQKAVEIYFDEMGFNENELTRCFEKGDWAGYTVRIHALKSTSRVIGAEGLSELARQLEEAGDAMDTSFIREHHNEFMERYRALDLKIAELSGTKEKIMALPPLKPGMLKEALTSMCELVDASDFDSVGFVLDELSKYRPTTEDEEILFRALKRTVDAGEWDILPGMLKSRLSAL
ncbi:Signal transduction histidine kinase [Lachnospiraceae bacterium]|nr:Signal transduction histidine kinase [Lachnospiraceae bacterium]